tara:strand:- start:104 stop:313 length:210 start_codon:yes stop_codon:yes gene_type:complete
MKYIVSKKCYALEHVSVIADSKEEAILKALDNDCKSLGNNLEFNGYHSRDDWQVETLFHDYSASSKSKE